MYIPKNLRVGSVNYKVTFEKFTGKKVFWGRTNFAHPHISLNTVIGKDLLYGTFMHELVETINVQYNLKMPHAELSALSEILYTVLNENKMLKK